jgi:1-acyl-sn-glycerol-3-phosphate acyltransferase
MLNFHIDFFQMFSFLSKAILKILGWKVIGVDHVLSVPKSVIAAAPHTSNWDFPLGILVRSAEKVPTYFLGKDSLFRPPFGWLFRALGGYPVDRSRSAHQVDAVVDLFNKHDKFSVTIAPEGTRSKVDRFRSGFYYMAVNAKVPIILAAFDFEKKEVRFSQPFYPSGNFNEDMKVIYTYFRGVKGYNTELQISFDEQVTK